MIKIWVDDERPAPEGYDAHAHSVCEAMQAIVLFPAGDDEILLDLDHDAGEFRRFGGDFITILDYLEYIDRKVGGGAGKIKVHFHSANPVGIKNMRAIVEHCPWMEEV